MPTPVSGNPSASRPLLAWGVVGGWLLFSLMVVAITWAGASLRGQRFSLASTLLWNFGWLLWAGATFLVARLARRFPLERPRLWRGLATHAGLGVAVGLGLLSLEFLLQAAIERLVPGAPRANALVGFIVYKFHVYFVIYAMIVGATRAYDYHTKLRASELHSSQLQAQLAQVQLAALKAQLHPHFLFNTHHAIISLMLKADNAAAIKMLTRLSDLLRITLRKTDQQVCALREELEALDLYLGIQRERYGDRLKVELAIEPAALDAEVPWLVLQPLVENALQHGIGALAAGGVLRVRARVAGDRLELGVSDNGPGFAVGFSPAQSNGIGLRNTQARLERLYGGDQRLEIVPPAEVRLILPLRRAAAPHA